MKTMKSLFLKSLSRRKGAIWIASILVFLASISFFVFEGTKKTVAFTLDGREKVIRTHADTIKEVLVDLKIQTRSEDYLFPSEETKITKDMKVVWEPAKQVEIITDNKSQTIWTTADTVEELLKQQKISLSDKDFVKPTVNESIKNRMKIAVKKAFPLTFINAGKKQQVWSTSTTVADFLEQQGVTLSKHDRVEPELGKTIDANAVVNVIRVEKVTDVVEEPIKFAVITKKDSSLSKGSKKVLKAGQEGLVSKTYEVIKENGKEVTRTLKSKDYIKDKTDKVVAVGTKVLVAQVSRGSSTGKEFYVNSTAYTASCNGCSGVTATGLNLHLNPNVKVIAVDPAIIPLGTKVYIEGYGYAIASDTGSAIRGHKIDVFFPSKAEAYRWGKRKVKIKILK